MARIGCYFTADLREAIVKEAEARGVTISEVVAIAVAKHLGRPELAHIPRKIPGRKPKERQGCP